MEGYIDNYNFAEMECMKYWQPAASWDDSKKKMEGKNRIMSGEWYGSQKRDGALYVFLKDEDGSISLRGRSKSVSGEYLDKWDHLPQLHSWGETVPIGTCFLGEVYWPDNEGSHNTTSIMNCLTDKAIARQKEEKNKLHYYIFDVVAFNGKSLLGSVARDRFEVLESCERDNDCPYVEYAHYECGEDLWNTLQELLANGYEGIVILKGNGLYEPGKRPSKTTMKIKKALKETIDCFFTGKAAAPNKEYNGKEIENWEYWINTETGERLEIKNHYYESAHEGRPYLAVTKPYYYGWAGSLEIGVLKNGEVCSLGYISGLPDEVKENWKDYKNRVVEISAMQFTDENCNRLRHGKITGWRSDKSWEDCDWEQIKNR